MDYFMIIFVLINYYEYFTEKNDKQYNIQALVIHIEKKVHLFFSFWCNKNISCKNNTFNFLLVKMFSPRK